MTLGFPAEKGGAAFALDGDTEPIRHFGDPAVEYRAATRGVAVRDRSHRCQWEFTGRQPLEMLKGIVSGVMPEAPETVHGVSGGRATYHTVLTPKGKIVADLWLWREATTDGEVVRAHLPARASGPLSEYLRRVLPPRLARLVDRSTELGMVSLLGPDAARLASGVALGLRVDQGDLESLEEGEFRILGGTASDRLMVLRSSDLSVPVFDVLGERAVLKSLWHHLTQAGAEPVGEDVWNALRIEAGRPAFGPELGPEVIPVEAGIQDRAIDSGKGCYTGQEVIVRIRDRGRVNRHLRRLRLDGAGDLPAPGTPLFLAEGRRIGEITSSAESHRRGRIALGYVRREVSPGQDVKVGGPDGPVAHVEEVGG